MKALLVLTLCLLSSCAAIPIGPAALLGKWRYADTTQSCYYVFRADGRFSGEVIHRGRLLSKFTGQWSVKGNALFYTYLSDALGTIPVGATDRDELLSVGKESFVIKAADGSRRRYLREK